MTVTLAHKGVTLRKRKKKKKKEGVRVKLYLEIGTGGKEIYSFVAYSRSFYLFFHSLKPNAHSCGLFAA